MVFSSKIPFHSQSIEEIKIRLHNKQNLFFISLIIIKKIILFFYKKLMIKVIKNYSKKIINFFNLNLRFLSDKKDLHKFIKLFKPYNCGYELIRFGDNSDGGYLLPNCLDNINNCFSPGVGNNIGFEKNILNRGISTFFLDHTINNFNFDIEKYENFTQKNWSIQ